MRREASIAERIATGELTARPRETRADKARSWWDSFKTQVIHTESGAAAAGDISGKDWFFAAQNLRHTAKNMAELADKYERIGEVVGDGLTRDQDADVIKRILGE